MRPDRVLLVDDEETFLEILAERLRSRGLDVTCVTSGEEALEVAEGSPFDAVVLDLAMPGLDGIETLRRLRAAEPDIQVMILSGRATIDTAVEAMRLGAIDILEKPAEVEALVERIRQARAKRLAEQDQTTQEQIEDILRTRGW